MPRFVVMPRVRVSYLALVAILVFAGCEDRQDSLTDPMTETVLPVSVGAEPLNLSFIPPVCDDAGPNDVPEQSDLNCFTRADDGAPNTMGIRWWWDDTNVWTGSGQTGDACGLIDTNANGFANLAVCAQFTNNAAGTQVIQLPAAGTAIVYACSDKRNDRCTKQITRLTSIGTTTCNVALGSEPTEKAWQGDDFPADVEATCELDLVALGITSTNLLNVCSYPSGEPNSNPFDCVITPGAGYLKIQKATTPATSADFSFVLSPAAAGGGTSYDVPGDDGLGGPGSSALIPVDPSKSYSLTETVPSGWTLGPASCSPSTGTFNGTNAITGISAATGQTVTCTFTNTLPPGITVTKTADPTSLLETGGSVQFSVVVTNTSAGALTLNSLTDDVFGDISDGSNASITGTTCSVTQALAPAGEAGDSYSCAFTADLAGSPAGFHVDTVTASASNGAGTATAKDSAKVSFTDIEPMIEVTKTASPVTVPETGADVTFTVLVENTAAEEITLTALADDVFGDLDGQGTCSVPQTLAAAGSPDDDYTCSFTKAISGVPGEDHVNEVTGTASDDDDNETTASDTAAVAITDVEPTVTVTKTAGTASVPETGASVTFSVAVSNTSAEPVTLNSLVDDVFGDLDGQGTCAVPQSLSASGQAGSSYGCSFSQLVSGDYPGMHVDTVTAMAADDDGSTATAKDSAKVEFTDVLPDITVMKTVTPTTLVAGATNPPPPGPDPTGDFEYLGWVCDTAGPDDVPAQSDLNCFTRADNQAPDVLAVKWTWDNTAVWTGSGQTGDACALFDTDATVNGFADVAVCAQFTNNASGTDVIQLPTNGSAIVYTCSDKKGDRCTKQIAQVTNIGVTTCSVTKGAEPTDGKSWMGDDTPNDVIAECELDLDVLPIPSTASLLNVCSFPSGEPNSNPFDCVVTPGAGYLVIEKATSPSSGEGFEFTVSPNPITNNNPYAVAGDDGAGDAGSSAIIPVTPGTYSITETLEANWDLLSVSCSDGSGTFNGTNAITGVAVAEGETVTCTFTNEWSLTGEVTYEVKVANNSTEQATLHYLDDDKFDDLDGQGTCSLNQTLAPAGQSGDSYTCTFTKSLTGSAGDTHTNVVTAKASDDDGNTDTETDDATVTFVGP